jgi:hypothetical protein
MGLGWDSVLKLAAVGVLIMIALQLIFYFVFQNIGYDSYLLSLNLVAFILVLIIFIIAWRIIPKKLTL